MRIGWWILLLLLCGAPAGCGTSKWSDTKRTATEQLLISDAMDRAVSRLDIHALAGKSVFLDNEAIRGAVDHAYLTSSMRQHMLASGCALKDEKEDADYVVELRVGAVGTDRHDVLYGVPAVNVPTVVPLSSVPSAIPEIPLAKKTDQRAVVKIAVFAYNRTTGRPVWQSGVVPVESQAKDFWLFGAGPFQRGTIYEGTSFAGDKLDIPLVELDKKSAETVSVADEAYFFEHEEQVAEDTSEAAPDEPSTEVVPAAAAEAPKTTPATKSGAKTPAEKEPVEKPPAEQPLPEEPVAGMTASKPAVFPGAGLFSRPLGLVLPGREQPPSDATYPLPAVLWDPDGPLEGPVSGR